MPSSSYYERYEDEYSNDGYQNEVNHGGKRQYASSKTNKPSLCRRLCGCINRIISCGFLLAGAYFAWDMSGRPSWDDVLTALGQIDVSDFKHVLGNLTDADWTDGFNEDPFNGMGVGGSDGSGSDPSEYKVWKQSQGNGLELTLQNALDSEWEDEFDSAVADWNECEALALSTITVQVDNSCQPVNGVMKVCNGNFGKTGWVGINELSLVFTNKNSNGVIESSVAKMNEYYLHNAAYEKRRYTMCHEIGHGFGLPHTDENMYNANMGNCLDYTTRPSGNMYPGEINFERLMSMYVDGYEANDDDGNGDGGDNDQGDDGNDGNNDNNRRNKQRRAEEEEELPLSQADLERGYVRRVIQRHYIWD